MFLLNISCLVLQIRCRAMALNFLRVAFDFAQWSKSLCFSEIVFARWEGESRSEVLPSNFLQNMGIIRTILFSFSDNSDLLTNDNTHMTGEQSYRHMMNILFGNFGGFRLKGVFLFLGFVLSAVRGNTGIISNLNLFRVGDSSRLVVFSLGCL